MTSRKISISNPLADAAPRDVSKDAKRKMEGIFDQSLAILTASQDPAITSPQITRATSLSSYSNSLPIHIDKFSLQRRALVDAAKALATLWKVPEAKGTRLRSRPLQLSKETS
jgi:hypothetical protein